MERDYLLLKAASASRPSGERFPDHAALLMLASAECRLPESLHFTECDVILGVVRARSVHKIGYGHNRDWSAA